MVKFRDSLHLQTTLFLFLRLFHIHYPPYPSVNTGDPSSHFKTTYVQGTLGQVASESQVLVLVLLPQFPQSFEQAPYAPHGPHWSHTPEISCIVDAEIWEGCVCVCVQSGAHNYF